MVIKNTDHRTIRTIEELVVKTIQGSNLARNHGQELSFVLPNTEIETFPVLFKKVYNVHIVENMYFTIKILSIAGGGYS